MSEWIDELAPTLGEAKSGTKWFPIETALDDMVVLVFAGGHVQPAYRINNIWFALGTGGIAADPTHWMPLPEGPQEDDK